MKTAVTMFAIACLVSACDRKKPLPVSAKPSMADSAEQVMYGVRLAINDKGVNKANIIGDTAYFMDDNTRMELQNVRTTFYGPQGDSNGVLTSKRARYNSVTKRMTAIGNVVVVTTEGKRLETPELTYDPSRRGQEIYSDSVFFARDRRNTWHGIGFITDPQMNNIKVLKNSGGSITDAITTDRPTTRRTPPRDTTKPRDSVRDTSRS
jgi:LPS export ABC transporter protein LptC